MTREEGLLSEIARKLRPLQCVCEGMNTTSGAIIKGYQPLDCNGDPVGSPIDVMATVPVSKQDMAMCNYQQLADAINSRGTFNYPVTYIGIVYPATTKNLNDLGLDSGTLHSISFTVLSGTVDINSDLGGGAPSSITALPAGISSGWEAQTVFGIGDISFTTDATGKVLVTATYQL